LFLTETAFSVYVRTNTLAIATFYKDCISTISSRVPLLWLRHCLSLFMMILGWILAVLVTLYL